jgi:hypothetical protein
MSRTPQAVMTSERADFPGAAIYWGTLAEPFARTDLVALALLMRLHHEHGLEVHAPKAHLLEVAIDNLKRALEALEEARIGGDVHTDG